MRNIIIALCLVSLMGLGSCTSSNKCTSKEATKYLTNSLKTNDGLHKVQVQLVKDNSNECRYFYTVKTKEFKDGIHYIVTKSKKQWKYTVVSQ